MNKGLIKYDWNFIENYTNEEISYFLTLEGKSVDAVAKIRNLDRATVQKHIINCKIKYRYLVKSKSPMELFMSLKDVPKAERLLVLNGLDTVNRERLIHYICTSYMDMELKDKEAAIWVMGEMRSSNFLDLLIKATVNNHVSIRRMAVSALGKLGDVKALRALMRALDDKNPQVVSYSVKSLQKLNSREADEKIKILYNRTDKAYIKKACEDYFKQVNEDHD
ncbi:HEAT repeat domain-containing protein [Clostridium culturomicium]|uniref:HEAT repeat domain-containing protein n=1 Tax=Clostridium culturomicium TaxID=1499683 RepID=UPI00058FE423|nr:HEAT repeat domain-containing protein [Clostridium culturomicium]